MMRPLGAMEKLFWLADQHRPIHFAVAAEVSGATRVEQWRSGLDRIGQGSPLVWSRIGLDPSGCPRFEPAIAGSLPLQVVEERAADWTVHVAAELARPFDAGRAPLLRATLLHGPRHSTIILCAHHSIADGLSLTYLVRDLLRLMAGEPVLSDPRTASLESLVERLGPERLPPAVRSELPVTETMRFRDADDTLPPRVTSMRLTRQMTAGLRDRARTERTTVHGVLGAAVVRAGSVLVPDWTDRPLRLLSPIDARARIGGSEHVGLCVTGIVLREKRKGGDLWADARAFTRQLGPAKTPAGMAAIVNFAQDAVSQVSTVPQASDLLAQAFGAELMLTNLGAVGIPSRYGPLVLESVWGPSVLCGFVREQTVGAITFGGRLHLLHTSHDPIDGLLDTAADLLHAALREADQAETPATPPPDHQDAIIQEQDGA